MKNNKTKWRYLALLALAITFIACGNNNPYQPDPVPANLTVRLGNAEGAVQTSPLAVPIVRGETKTFHAASNTPGVSFDLAGPSGAVSAQNPVSASFNNTTGLLTINTYAGISAPITTPVAFTLTASAPGHENTEFIFNVTVALLPVVEIKVEDNNNEITGPHNVQLVRGGQSSVFDVNTTPANADVTVYPASLGN